jgi:hypothetical protein
MELDQTPETRRIIVLTKYSVSFSGSGRLIRDRNIAIS